MDTTDGRMDRREAIKWIAASLATVSLLKAKTFAGAESASRYGFDPALVNPTFTWPRTLDQAQLKTVTALCDLIIPEDEISPSASMVRVPDFIDEWISAPYPDQAADKEVILAGLDWLDKQAAGRFSQPFAELDEGQMAEICNEISYLPDAKNQTAARFFATFRNLTAGGFYTTEAGMKDIGYVGNTPLASFTGPPMEVLKHLGLA